MHTIHSHLPTPIDAALSAAVVADLGASPSAWPAHSHRELATAVFGDNGTAAAARQRRAAADARGASDC